MRNYLEPVKGLDEEKAMAPHSSTLAWKIRWTEEPVGCSPWRCKESDTTEWLHFHFSLSCIGEGNGNPLQCSCLENPRDGGAWWAAVHGVTQSRTRLKRLSSSSSSKGLDERGVHFVVPREINMLWLIQISLLSIIAFPLSLLPENSSVKGAVWSPSHS